MTARAIHPIALLLLSISLLLGAGIAVAAEPGDAGDSGPIKVTADELSAEDGASKIEASGNVEITRDDMTLKADEVRMNRETQDVEAVGNVSVHSPEWQVRSAESLRFNLGSETGEGRDAKIFVEQGHISITGRRFQKFEGQAYHLDDVFFTTCVCESGAPHWRISAEQFDLSPEGLGTVRNGYFYILDVPVFYIPYGFFPLRTERQTGFLFPEFGSSTKEGFRFQQPFFWAISKSTDATLALDVQTRARLGAIGEFRTLFDRDSDFQLNSSYFNENLRKNEEDAIEDRTIADQRIPENRWNVAATHRYLTANDWLTYSDIAAYSDDLFTRELVDRFDVPGGRQANIKTSRFSDSRFGVFRNWGDAFFQGEWKFYQDFVQPDEITLHRTPYFAHWGRHFLANFPLEFRWRADAVNYMRRVGGDGLRLDLRPEMVLPFRMGRYVFGSFNVAPRETAYHLYSPVKSSERNLSRELVEIRGQIGTTLSRLFAWRGWGVAGIKHVIEPELSYLFVPKTDQSHIPIMDGKDRINRRNVVTLAVNNRVWGKSVGTLVESWMKEGDAELLNPVIPGNVRELGNLRLALSYDVDKERNGGDSLSDIDINLRVNPREYLTMSFDAGADPGPWQLTQARARFTISDPRPVRQTLDADFNQPNSVSFGYTFLQRGPNAFLAEDANIDLDAPADCINHRFDPRCPTAILDKNLLDQVGGSLLYHVTDHLLFFFSGGYNFRDQMFPDFRSSIKILSQCECWSMTFSLRRSTNPSKTTFSFGFNLLGLGESRRTLQ